MRKINEIIIHCSATQPGWMKDRGIAAKVEEIWRWHKARGFRALGYHYVIDRDGKEVAGRPLEQIGAHTRGRNKHSVGVCLIGGFSASADDNFYDHFTTEQDIALRRRINRLHARFGDIPVTAHHMYANKACPGFRVNEWFNGWFKQPVDAPIAPPAPPSPWTAFFSAISKMFGVKK